LHWRKDDAVLDEPVEIGAALRIETEVADRDGRNPQLEKRQVDVAVVSGNDPVTLPCDFVERAEPGYSTMPDRSVR
jgi:hypothetical protein